jgi:integrase
MQSIDRRSVVNHRQARALLDAVAAQKPSGPRLVAFFGLIYYAALRPEEAVNLRWNDLFLPPEGNEGMWGELRLSESAPYVGRQWTDDGDLRDTRALKHRLDGESRIVPLPPDLVTILRDHSRQFPDGADGRLFYGIHADVLPTITYRRAWKAARRTALSESEQASPLAQRPYDLRHAAVSTWLNAGVPAPQVAEWAGHGVDVLLRIYAKCVEGQEPIAKMRIALALQEGLDADNA